jgi:8-oxo-dGTP pyrophosphatase MutT (NUDIX family)
MQKPSKISVKAFCVFRDETRILVFEGFDTTDNVPFYRPLGGSVEPGELSQEAVKREILEELGEEIKNVKLLGVLEEIFTHEGKPGHKVIFIYDAEFIDKARYEKPSMIAVEANGEVLKVSWKDLDFFNDDHRLVPVELKALLEASSLTSNISKQPIF